MQKQNFNPQILDELLSVIDSNNSAEREEENIIANNTLKSEHFTASVNKLHSMFSIVSRQSKQGISNFEIPISFMINLFLLFIFFFYNIFLNNITNSPLTNIISNAYSYPLTIFMILIAGISYYNLSFFNNISINHFNAMLQLSKIKLSHIYKVIKFKNKYKYVPHKDMFDKFFSKIFFKTRVAVNQSVLSAADAETTSFYYPDKNRTNFLNLVNYFRSKEDYFSQKKAFFSKIKLPFLLGRYGIYAITLNNIFMLSTSILFKNISLFLNLGSSFLLLSYLIVFNVLSFKAKPLFNIDFEEKRFLLEEFLENKFEADLIKLGLFSDSDFFDKDDISSDEIIKRITSLSDVEYQRLTSLIMTDTSLFNQK